MPHVASALKSHVAHRPPAARPAQAPDRASSTPFANLLDDNAPAPERPPQPAANDQGSRPARSDQTAQPARSTDSKAATAKDDASATDAVKTDKTDKTGKTDQIANDSETAADAKPGGGEIVADVKIAKPTEGKDAALINDSKPANALVATEAATAPPTEPLPAIRPAVVSVTVLPSAADNAATVTTPVPAQADALAAPQAGMDQAGNGAAPAAKTTAQPHGEAKPQDLAGEFKPQGPAGNAPDKDAIAQAREELARGEAPRGELADTAHRSTPAQANAALAADTMTAAPKAGADVAPPIAHTAPLQTTAPAAPTPAASAPLPQPAAIPFAGVAVEIAGKALAGKNYFEIRLDPPELGRIEVRLDVDRDGNVTSRMIADRADTLDLLRRDVSGLERALQDAGLKTSDNGLQFSLRDQSAQQQQAGRASDSARLVVEDDMLPIVDTTPRSYSRLAGLGSGVDIHV
ncbi:MAG: flagellar hook-length control protein FliK [Rhizobiales bacterium]|nr:flagellar hook-length control protein FliK [Hyphomicrobiales bacterium]